MDAEIRVRESFDFDEVRQVIDDLEGFEVASYSIRAETIVVKNVNDTKVEKLKKVLSSRAEVKLVATVSDPWHTWD